MINSDNIGWILFGMVLAFGAAVVSKEIYHKVYLGEVEIEKTETQELLENVADILVVEMKMEKPAYDLVEKNWVFIRTQFLSYPWEKYMLFMQICLTAAVITVAVLAFYGWREISENQKLLYLHHDTDKSITKINLFRHSVEVRLAEIKKLNLVCDESHYTKVIDYLKELAQKYSSTKFTLDDFVAFKEKLVEFQQAISDNLDYTLFLKLENFKSSMKTDVEANIKRNKWKKK